MCVCGGGVWGCMCGWVWVCRTIRREPHVSHTHTYTYIYMEIIIKMLLYHSNQTFQYRPLCAKMLNLLVLFGWLHTFYTKGTIYTRASHGSEVGRSILIKLVVTFLYYLVKYTFQYKKKRQIQIPHGSWLRIKMTPMFRQIPM